MIPDDLLKKFVRLVVMNRCCQVLEVVSSFLLSGPSLKTSVF